ncbi:aminotransferase class I/II-fold pyridoxal phosphate-dependent enzyme [Flavobacterium pallidum]|uniref:8-amino-7-oxononanoate synthase n=1 Tax=Flavobacterium pallidum TaxID=2172098 RepID=A0A2S1SEP9_9FLAO|nr:8-amino-7-oxononanoate synthase [Flavobacterium pallidum]AWI24837.1 8-amino-7-oxononanoate synthase [Flavobacterium pallidum]
MKFPEKLAQKLEIRRQQNAFRQLPQPNGLIDLASNDYLGFSKSEAIFSETHEYLVSNHFTQNGATGSRLISGNHPLYEITEEYIADFHESETALIFNSGYDANVGFFSSLPQKDDVILYDELCHASIRDGIRLSNAKSYKFAHNDPENLEELIVRHQSENTKVYVATESVFSMDGDTPPLERFVCICEKHQAFLVIDEAHALGVFGNTEGSGMIQELQLQHKVFARIMTFGKGLGCHGAAIIGSEELKDYLVNFARSFIYTTGLSPHALATILISYQHLQQRKDALEQLKKNIIHFNQTKNLLGLKPLFVYSKSTIQCAVVPGNEKVKSIAIQLQQNGFDVKAILSPTVPTGQERLRICLHSYNSEAEISQLLQSIAQFTLA